MKKFPATVAGLAVVASSLVALTGCSTNYPDIAGVWKASDGTANKTISDDGNCTNLLYRGSTMFHTDAPGMCHIVASTGNGDYTMKVHQDPYTVSYTAAFSDDDKTIVLTRGGKTVVKLTQVPSVH